MVDDIGNENTLPGPRSAPEGAQGVHKVCNHTRGRARERSWFGSAVLTIGAFVAGCLWPVPMFFLSTVGLAFCLGAMWGAGAASEHAAELRGFLRGFRGAGDQVEQRPISTRAEP